MKQRCAVEKSYGEAMQKISANYLNKKMPPIHEMTANDQVSNQQWTVWSIWRSLLEETDKLAKAKLAAVEIFQQQIAEDAKHVRQNKLHIAKKVYSTHSLSLFSTSFSYSVFLILLSLIARNVTCKQRPILG